MSLPMIFDEKYACEFGLEESVMLQNILYWVRKNKANNKHFHDGRYWTYNSAAAFTKLFPFWNRRKIARILQSLVKQGAICAGNYNENPIDRTLWYSVNEKIMEQAEAMGQIRPMDRTEPSNARVGSDTPIPYINADVNADSICMRFEEFYMAYPKKRNRGDAEKAWKKLMPDAELFEKIMGAVARAKETPEWKKEGGQYVPYPASWLRAKGWLDVLAAQSAALTSGYRRYGDAD